MIIKLLNAKDKETLEKVALLQNQDATLTKLLSTVAEATCPTGEDFSCKIAKAMLVHSYQYNPSLMASKVRSLSPSFQDAGGRVDPDAPSSQIIITLYRTWRDRTQPYQERARNSLKQRVKNAIQQGYIISVPISEIPPFYLSHSEQLTYQIKRETGNKIKITKLKSSWKIQLV